MPLLCGYWMNNLSQVSFFCPPLIKLFCHATMGIALIIPEMILLIFVKYVEMCFADIYLFFFVTYFVIQELFDKLRLKKFKQKHSERTSEYQMLYLFIFA